MPGQKITQNVPLIPAWQDSQTPQVPVRDAVASRICIPFPLLLVLVQGPRLFICNMSPTASFLQDILPLLLINFARFPALATQLSRITLKHSICLGIVIGNRLALLAFSSPPDLKDF